jgi:hypothetical protein
MEKKQLKQEYNPLKEEEYNKIKVGDVIERMLAFAIPGYLTVTAVDGYTITCNYWVFSKKTGIEIDEDIPGPVSYISRVLSKKEVEELKLKEK